MVAIEGIVGALRGVQKQVPTQKRVAVGVAPPAVAGVTHAPMWAECVGESRARAWRE